MLQSQEFLSQLYQQFTDTSVFEWAGLITTLACIWLAAKENIWNWPISVISIVISAVIYFENELFGDFALQFYFLFTAIYGWYFWMKKKGQDDRPVSSLNARQWGLAILAIAILSPILGYLLDNYTPTNVPYEDGTCTAISFVAQIMLTRKILQNWILWIIVDILYVPLLVYKGLNLYAVLYAILVIIAVKGFIDWRKTYREQAN